MEMKNDDVQNSLNSKVESVENTSKVAHDPGWNDPPKLSFGAMGQTKFVKKGLLNRPKRVAFPLNSNPTTSPSSSSLQASPHEGDFCLPSTFMNPFDRHMARNITIDPSIIKKAVSLIDSSDPDKPKEAEDKSPQLSSLDIVMAVFEKVIRDYISPKPTSEDGDKVEIEIRRRLQVLSTMWIDGKLNEDVQKKMVQLAEALDKGQGSLANDLHIEMIVDHTSQVSAWMPGIRKLVHCCMLAAEKANKKEAHTMEDHKTEDQKEDLATEIRDKEILYVDKTSEYHPSS